MTEALGSTHSRRQLKINVICKADSDEPKNKSEFVFLLLFFLSADSSGSLYFAMVIRYNFPRCYSAGGH